MSHAFGQLKENSTAQGRDIDDTWMIYHSKAGIKYTWMHAFRSRSQAKCSRYTERNRLWIHWKWRSMAHVHTFSLLSEARLIHSYYPFVYSWDSYSCVSWNIQIWRTLRHMHETSKLQQIGACESVWLAPRGREGVTAFQIYHVVDMYEYSLIPYIISQGGSPLKQYRFQYYMIHCLHSVQENMTIGQISSTHQSDTTNIIILIDTTGG